MLSLADEWTNALDRFLIGIDEWPWSAVYRVAIGLGIPPTFRLVFGDRPSVWLFLAAFAGLLLALRVVPLVLRRVLSFSAEAQQVWLERRLLARHHDSLSMAETVLDRPGHVALCRRRRRSSEG